jgi:hypothetical protein
MSVVVVILIAIAVVIRYRGGNNRRRYEAVLTSALDRLVTAQEGLYYDSTHYTASLRALPGLQLSPSVHLQILSPDRRSWWAIATHDLLPARHCVVWVGTAPATLPPEARAPEDETKPLCFDDARTVGNQSPRP